MESIRSDPDTSAFLQEIALKCCGMLMHRSKRGPLLALWDRCRAQSWTRDELMTQLTTTLHIEVKI